MRACKQCGLSIGDMATFCPVCGADADPGEAPPTIEPAAASAASDEDVEVLREETRSLSAEPSPRVLGASDYESEARRCEKTDAPRAAALYRRAILEYLESSDDSLDGQSVRRDMQRIFDRLSLVLKRSGLIEEALEEIDSAAYLGLVDDEACGTEARREALIKRRDTLRRALAKAEHDEG
jgi:predicted Zn-dependent protease with MMP-like domain